MIRFYYVLPPDNSVVATISDKCNIDFVDELRGNSCSIFFNAEEETLCDILANDLGWPLYSEKVKDIIDSLVKDKSHYVWHKVSIVTFQCVTDYYVPQFIKVFDVLDPSHSICVEGGFVVKACIDPAKAYNRGIFPVPGSDSRVIVSEEIYRILNDKGVDTSSFETVSTSPKDHH